MRMYSQVFSNVRMRPKVERQADAARAARPPKPKHWRKGIRSTWHKLEDHAAQWDGKGGLIAVPRLRLGRKTR